MTTAKAIKLPLFTRAPRFAREQSGITVIEFAIIAPVFLLIVTGIIEFSLIMFTATVMESATNITSRVGKTGFAGAGMTRQQQIISTVDAKTAGLLDPNKITVTTEVYSDFNDISQPEPCITHSPCPGVAGVNFVDINGNGSWDQDMGAAGLGGAGDVVVYKISYPWHVTTPLISAILGSTYTITARSVVRNEPFGSGVGG